MKKTKKIIAVLAAVACVFAMSPVGVFAAANTAKPAAAPTAAVKTVKVTFSSSSSSGFDMAGKTVTAKSNMTETYYPLISEPSGVVTVSDVIVAAHIAKYGSAFTSAPTSYYDIANSSYGVSVKKQFGNSQVGLYYVNHKAIKANVSTDTVKNGDVVDICSFTSGWNDLYSYFDKNTYRAEAGRTFYVLLNAAGSDPNTYAQTEVVPNTCTIQKLDAATGTLTAMSGKTDDHGIASVRFNTPGTYYISAKGTVTYNGYSGKTTGNIMCPAAKVIVNIAGPSRAGATAAGWTSAKVSWSKVSGVNGYKIYRAVKKNGTYKIVKTVKGASSAKWTNKKLKTGKKYYYKVKAYKGSLRSAASPAASVRVVAKAPVLKLTAKNNAIKSVWSERSGSTGYKLYMASSKNGKYHMIRNARGSWNNDYTRLHRTAGKNFYFKVKAYKTVNGKKIYSSYSKIKFAAAK